MSSLRDKSKGGSGSSGRSSRRRSDAVAGGADDAAARREVADLDPNRPKQIPECSTRWYRILEKIEERLPNLDTASRSALTEVGGALKAAREAQAMASRLLRGTTSVCSRSRKGLRAANEVLALKLQQALMDPTNTEVHEREDGTKRPQAERRMIAEAQLWSLREEKDRLEDLVEGWTAFRECVKSTLQSIRAYRSDIRRYLDALTEMRETGLGGEELEAD